MSAGIHITLLLTAAVSGFIAAHAMGEVNRAFGNNCVLYAVVNFVLPKTTYKPLITSEAPSNTTESTPDTTTVEARAIPGPDEEIDTAETKWGTYRMCSFCQFTPIVSMIFALLWLAFFVMCGKGGRGYESDL